MTIERNVLQLCGLRRLGARSVKHRVADQEGLATGMRLLALTGVNRQFGWIVLQCRGSAGSRVPEIRDRNCVWLTRLRRLVRSSISC